MPKKFDTSPIIDSRPFSFDPETRLRKTFHYHDNGSFTIEEVQDYEPIIEANKREQNANLSTKGEVMRRQARIPLTLLFRLKQEGILDDPKRFQKWLEDPINRNFRTRTDKL